MRSLLITVTMSSLLLVQVPVAAQNVVELRGFPRSSAQQRMPMWCWAAAVESVFRYYGVRRSQEQIVIATYGRLVNAGAYDPRQLYRALNAASFSESGRVDVTAGSFGFGAPPPAFLLTELRDDHPVVAWYLNPGGAGGHAVVIFGAEFNPGPMGPVVTALKIWDPWPGAGVRVVAAPSLAAAMTNYFVVRAVRERRASPSVDEDEDYEDPPPSPRRRPAPRAAHWCCTSMGRYGPYLPNDVAEGQPCWWATPGGPVQGIACN